MRPRNLEKEQAIRDIALKIISEEGLENLTMQKLAEEANVSPRTIYIKYENKEDLLIKLFIEVALAPYEKAILKDFTPDMDLTKGIRKLWDNAFTYLTNNRTHYALMRYGRSSPQLNKAFQQANIGQGDYFGPIHTFLSRHIGETTIPDMHIDIYKALIFSPLAELVNEYFDYTEREEQIITPQVVRNCCDILIKGLTKK